MNFIEKFLPGIYSNGLGTAQKIDFSQSSSVKLPLGIGSHYATIVIAASNARTTLNADYICTGTNDNTIIASALAALSTNGGRILLSDGTFNLGGSLTISSKNITIEGQGLSTILQLSNNVNPTNGIINITGVQTYNYQLKNFLLDGNYSNQTGTGSGIYINTNLDSSDSMQVIEDVEVRNCLGSGFNLQQGGQLNMRRCRASYNRVYGFNLNASDGVFHSLIADTNQLSGIYANCFAGHYTDCKAYYNASAGSFDAGIYIKAYNSYLVNCEGEDNYYNGIVIDGSANGCILNNCIGDSNGQTSGSGLVIYGNNNIVSGGAYFERASPPAWTQVYGINLLSTATGNVCVGSITYSNGTAGYHDGSNGTNYHIGTNPSVLATGAAHTVDDIITFLQNLGLAKQS